MFIDILLFLFYSIIIVLISKYLLVKILRKIGELLKLKPKTIGNIAGIATSIPELLTVSFSAFAGLIGTSTYNIISSNVINVVQYVASIILNKNQKVLRNKAIKIDLWLVILTIVIPIIMLIFNIESNLAIVPIFVILLFTFFKITNNVHQLYGSKAKREKFWNIDLMMRNRNKEEGKETTNEEKSRITVESYTKKGVATVVKQGVYLAIVGIILYVVGNLLGDVLESLCLSFHVPEFILGILLGFVTSIPELITFFESQKHHANEKEGVIEATGNLLTSNIMNLFVIQTIGILIYAIF